jgi:alpha-2-macroglobulin
VSETQQLPIDGLDAGVYLIEATDGTYKAYTVAIVTSIAVVERTVDGKAILYVADRKTGAPVGPGGRGALGDGKLQSSGKTGSDGMASLTYDGARRRAGSGAGECVDPGAPRSRRRAGDAVGYGFGAQRNQQQERDYIYTDRPVYRPGHTVHIKAIVRKEVNDNLVLPDERTLTLRVTGPDNKVVFNKELPVSAHGTVRRTSISPPMRRWVTTASIQRENAEHDEYEGGAAAAASTSRSTRSPSTR